MKRIALVVLSGLSALVAFAVWSARGEHEKDGHAGSIASAEPDPLEERAELAQPAEPALERRTDSRRLARDEAVVANPGEGELELRPHVSAILEGRVLPPLGVSLDAKGGLMQGVRVCLTNPGDAGLAGTPEGDGRFVLMHVPTGVELELRVENPWGPALHQAVAAFAPAERRSVVLALELGITIAGRVIDERGQPVRGEVVQAMEQASPRSSPEPADSDALQAETDADGRFELHGLARRSWKVVVEVWDSGCGTTVFVDGSAGDARDLVLVVECGGCIEGTLEWPDGRPVGNFTVSASDKSFTAQRDGSGSRFRICGLADGAYDVEAHVPATDSEGYARVSGVRPGDAGARLVLESRALYTVQGRVTDRSGRPASGVKVSPRYLGPGGTGNSASWSNLEGGFRMTLGCAGEWRIQVIASGLRSAEQIVLVGPNTEPVRFVLDTAGRVTGRVLDPDGAPVAGAIVGRQGVRPLPRARGDGSAAGHDRNAFTDAEGRFEYAATSSPVRIQAACEGYAPSALVEASAESGETSAGIVLGLRAKCRVEGRVLDADVRPLPGALVTGEVDGVWENTETDARGEFVMDGLPPALGTLGARPSFFSTDRASAQVALISGQATSVELRLEKPDPVRVNGRLVRSGVPIAGSIRFLSRSYSVSARAESDGAFEVALPRPGPCWGSVQLPRRDLATAELYRFELTVPDADAHDVVLDLETLQRIQSLAEVGY